MMLEAEEEKIHYIHHVTACKGLDIDSSVVSVGHFLNQPDCNRVAKFLTHV